MKKIIISVLLVFAVITLVIVFCCIKKEYNINETAKINNISIKLIKIEKINNSLQITINIKNHQKGTFTINPDKNFKFYDKETALVNTYMSNNNTIKKDSEQTYTLQYEYKEEQKLYTIYFYESSNSSIKFVFTNQDIR